VNGQEDKIGIENGASVPTVDFDFASIYEKEIDEEEIRGKLRQWALEVLREEKQKIQIEAMREMVRRIVEDEDVTGAGRNAHLFAIGFRIHPDETQSAVASRLKCSQSSVSRCINRNAEKVWINRNTEKVANLRGFWEGFWKNIFRRA
jgi:hypothetical protein